MEYELFFSGLNNALFGKGDLYIKGMEAVDMYLKQWDSYKNKKFIWRIIRLSQNTLEKLIKGEIKEVDNIEELTYIDKNDKENNCGILVFTIFEKDIYEREVSKYYIYSMFMPEII